MRHLPASTVLGGRCSISARVATALILLLGASCTQHQNLVDLKDDQHYLSFAGVACLPDVFAGEPVEAGKKIDCIFLVEGVAMADVTLSCESELGEPVDCLNSSGYLRLTAHTEFPDEIISPIFPMARCRFELFTEFIAGESVEPVVWVATDGDHTIRQRFAPELIPNDQVNETPDIWVDCGPQDLDNVHPGSTLNCFIYVHDPDPGDTADFLVSLVGNPGPPPGLLDLAPMQGHGPGIIPWHWRIDSHAPLGLWTFAFTIPGTDARYDLDVVLR